MPTSFNHVSHILRVVTLVEVVDPNATGVIATMQDVYPRVDGADLQFPSGSVGKHSFSFGTHREPAVPVVANVSHPFPTVI
jgi:hypothetical protein